MWFDYVTLRWFYPQPSRDHTLCLTLYASVSLRFILIDELCVWLRHELCVNVYVVLGIFFLYKKIPSFANGWLDVRGLTSVGFSQAVFKPGT
jgi:hypothetical protein